MRQPPGPAARPGPAASQAEPRARPGVSPTVTVTLTWQPGITVPGRTVRCGRRGRRRPEILLVMIPSRSTVLELRSGNKFCSIRFRSDPGNTQAIVTNVPAGPAAGDTVTVTLT
eukprot:760069-Hanusia_phi.AAC.1